MPDCESSPELANHWDRCFIINHCWTILSPLSYRLISLVTKQYSGYTSISTPQIIYPKLTETTLLYHNIFCLSAKKPVRSCINPRLISNILRFVQDKLKQHGLNWGFPDYISSAARDQLHVSGSLAFRETNPFRNTDPLLKGILNPLKNTYFQPKQKFHTSTN